MNNEMLELNMLLIKAYMFVLFAFMMTNDYCNTRIKQMQNKRKSYNLLSKVIEVELTERELNQLYFLMHQQDMNDTNKYLRKMLFN